MERPSFQSDTRQQYFMDLMSCTRFYVRVCVEQLVYYTVAILLNLLFLTLLPLTLTIDTVKILFSARRQKGDGQQ
jgi:hypothetical protein